MKQADSRVLSQEGQLAWDAETDPFKLWVSWENVYEMRLNQGGLWGDQIHKRHLLFCHALRLLTYETYQSQAKAVGGDATRNVTLAAERVAAFKALHTAEQSLRQDGRWVPRLSVADAADLLTVAESFHNDVMGSLGFWFTRPPYLGKLRRPETPAVPADGLPASLASLAYEARLYRELQLNQFNMPRWASRPNLVTLAVLACAHGLSATGCDRLCRVIRDIFPTPFYQHPYNERLDRRGGKTMGLLDSFVCPECWAKTDKHSCPVCRASGLQRDTCPLTVSSSWCTPGLRQLVRGLLKVDRSPKASALDPVPCYDQTGVYAVADALEEAGCGDQALLGHLRDPLAQHAVGCWAIDLYSG